MDVISFSRPLYSHFVPFPFFLPLPIFLFPLVSFFLSFNEFIQRAGRIHFQTTTADFYSNYRSEQHTKILNSTATTTTQHPGDLHLEQWVGNSGMVFPAD
jgi:hypothetical protein